MIEDLLMDKVRHYYKDLNSLAEKISATDTQGSELTFPDGIICAIKVILSQVKTNNKLIFIGNGGSAAIASHQAIDFWKNGGIRAVTFNDASLLTCISNDFGYKYVFEKPIEMFADHGDVLIAISSSGKSENILKGLKAARQKKCRIITLSGFSKRNTLRSLGDLNFYVPSNSYGFVEIIHLSICHCILDTIIRYKSSKKPL